MLHEVAPTLTQASGRAAASLRSRPHRCCHAWLYVSNDTASDAAFCVLTSNSRAAVPGPDGALSPSSPAGCRLPARGWQATLGPVHGAVDTDCRPEAPSQGRRGTSQSATRALLSRLSGKRKARRRVPPGWEGAPGPLLLRACRPPPPGCELCLGAAEQLLHTGTAEDEEAEGEGLGGLRGQAVAHGDRQWPTGQRVSPGLGVARSRLSMAWEPCVPCRDASALGSGKLGHVVLAAGPCASHRLRLTSCSPTPVGGAGERGVPGGPVLRPSLKRRAWLLPGGGWAFAAAPGRPGPRPTPHAQPGQKGPPVAEAADPAEASARESSPHEAQTGRGFAPSRWRPPKHVQVTIVLPSRGGDSTRPMPTAPSREGCPLRPLLESLRMGLRPAHRPRPRRHFESSTGSPAWAAGTTRSAASGREQASGDRPQLCRPSPHARERQIPCDFT